MAAASAAATVFRLSVAASRLEDLIPCRVPGADAPGYEYAAASRLIRANTTKRGKLRERRDFVKEKGCSSPPAISSYCNNF